MFVYPVKGEKDWDTGYTRITQALAVDPELLHPETGVPGSPRVFISSHCTHFIKEALGYRWKKNRITSQLRNSPDEPMDYNDHHMDAWFYFEASRPNQPIIQVVRRRDVLEEIKAARLRYNPFTEEVSSKSWMAY